jgi:hypothetical protein
MIQQNITDNTKRYASVSTMNFDPGDGGRQRHRNAASNYDSPRCVLYSLLKAFTTQNAGLNIFIFSFTPVTPLD